MGSDRAGSGEFGFDLFCELFSKFDSHLVVGVDIPDCALNKDLMFIECNQTSESFRVKSLNQQRVRRAIARKNLVRD